MKSMACSPAPTPSMGMFVIRAMHSDFALYMHTKPAAREIWDVLNALVLADEIKPK